MHKDIFRCLLIYNPKSLKKLAGNLSEIDELTFFWEENYHTATQLIADGRVDVVILEADIRDEAGLTTFKRLLSVAVKIPIIVADESSDTELIKKFLLAGASDYFLKGRIAEKEIAERVRYAVVRKQSELSLRESYRMIANFTVDWEYWENPNGTIQFVSPACEKITGYSAPEFIQNPALYKEIILHEDRKKFSEHHCGDLTRKGVRKTHFRIRRRDGQIRWIEHTCQLAFDEHETYLGIRVTNRDTTELIQADDDLEKSEQKFQKLIETANDAIFICEVESGKITNVNQKACELTGYTAPELIGRPYYDIYPPEDRPFYKEFFEERVYNTSSPQRNIFVQNRDGRKIPVEVSGSVTTFRGKTFMLDIYRDITERLETELQLRKLSSAVEQSPSSAVIMDTTGRLEYANPKFMQTTGYNLNEIIGQNWFSLKTDHLTQNQSNDIWKNLQTGQAWRGELHSKKKDGTFFWEYTAISPIRRYDGNISHFLAVSEDITIRKQYEEQLLRQATYDNLTQLPNRLLMLDRLKQAVARVKRENIKTAILFIDLDHFKDVNDTLGHDNGDKLLIEVARRLQNCIRGSDTVSRLGGDEFLVILQNIGEETMASIVAQRILESLAAPVIVENQEIFISASIGITVAPNDSDDPQVLLRNSDAAMYQSKEASRNTFHFFTAEMNERVRLRMQISTRLRHAIEENALSLLYQPIIDVKTEKCVGAEALIRWKDSQLGPVFPDQFIPIAEETNQIIPIGKWVMETALTQAKQWQTTILPNFRMSVNVSVRQLKDTNLGRETEDVVRRLNIPPETIEMEITEGFILSQNPVILKNLESFRQLGVHMAVDDFGTGYASFGYFSKFSFHTLKIDRQFLWDTGKDPSKTKLFQAIIYVGQSLGLKIVSEGVETKEHLDLIRSFNCDYLQGFYFAKPLTVPDFEEFLRKNK